MLFNRTGTYSFGRNTKNFYTLANRAVDKRGKYIPRRPMNVAAASDQFERRFDRQQSPAVHHHAAAEPDR